MYLSIQHKRLYFTWDDNILDRHQFISKYIYSKRGLHLSHVHLLLLLQYYCMIKHLQLPSSYYEKHVTGANLDLTLNK